MTTAYHRVSWGTNDSPISDLLGKTFTSVRGMSKYDPEVVRDGGIGGDQLSDKQLWLHRVDTFLGQHA